MNQLIINKTDTAEKHLVLYRDMCQAISSCARIDECKDIADKSVALAAYFRQTKDDAMVQQFNQVRLRAWRRVGELLSAVDTSDCETGTAKINKIRASFDHAVIGQITESRVREILELMKVSDKDFEYAMAHRDLTGSIPDLLTRTPQHKAMVKKNLAARKPQPQSAADIAREQRQAKQTERINRHFHELTEASNEALKGITLDEKERANLKPIVILLEPKVYAALRRAASEQELTMQKILQLGLGMWLESYGS